MRPDEGASLLPGARRRRLAAIVVLVAAAVLVQGGLLWLSHFPEPRGYFADEARYLNGARLLAQGMAWHPEPLWPPLQAWFLAGLLIAGRGSLLAVELAGLALLWGSAFLLRDLVRRLTGSETAGWVAAGLLLAQPAVASFAFYLWPEVLHLFLFLAAVWILVERGDRLAWLAGAGVLLGLALLAKNILGPFLPVLLLPLALRGPPRRRLQRIAAVVLALAATVAPTVRSNRARGEGVWVADSVAFNLWVGLNDRSRASFVDPVVGDEWRIYESSAPTFPGRRAILQEKIAALVRQRGLARVLAGQIGRQYFRLFDRESFFTDQLPGGGIHAFGRGYRAPAPLLAAALRWWSYLLYGLLLLAFPAGLAVVRHRGHPWLKVGVGFIAYNLALFLFLHVKSRYRIAFEPFLALYAGAAIAWWWEHRTAAPSGRFRPSIPAWAWPLAAILLFLAFGGPLLG